MVTNVQYILSFSSCCDNSLFTSIHHSNFTSTFLPTGWWQHRSDTTYYHYQCLPAEYIPCLVQPCSQLIQISQDAFLSRQSLITSRNSPVSVSERKWTWELQALLQYCSDVQRYDVYLSCSPPHQWSPWWRRHTSHVGILSSHQLSSFSSLLCIPWSHPEQWGLQ